MRVTLMDGRVVYFALCGSHSSDFLLWNYVGYLLRKM
jgi:hypothetical protein